MTSSSNCHLSTVQGKAIFHSCGASICVKEKKIYNNIRHHGHDEQSSIFSRKIEIKFKGKAESKFALNFF